MKIDSVTMPNIKIKPVEKALQALFDHCEQVTIQVMKMNNEIEDLKEKIYRLEKN